MDDTVYRKWLETIDALSSAQRADVRAILSGRSSEAEVIAALEGHVLAERLCVVERAVCGGSTVVIAARRSTPLPARRWRSCTIRGAGWISASRLAKEKRCANRRTGAIWR